MSNRLNYAKLSTEMFQKLAELSGVVRKGVIDHKIIDLVEIRASQLNGCAFCLDMHVKQAKINGERELRLHHVAIWKESPLFDPRERAALAWTEALTASISHGVSDELYEKVRGQFSEKELSDLTFAVMTINAWNRAGVAFLATPGSADKLYGLDKAGLN
ncbi:carboxymuconolactone decarboxylase family protein [Rhizobiaceae bacterium n13]|uniref:Carboxymuconolactone decarboxylase family protein n=1 Tax=Ferirhizobium litorale TaxID=2927786 RepID=A0AAE3QE89_9HYPH|nr:carboxymuconolactone decarboxylase family protein [Fererhizobium litorale]MDI7863440.1 carboxymuconolactone decarboxylase family protein [Fererhizobium litorale]MDI7922283.1 carboxymuconolactone decarboxylase family protein [Fererhizobium litorale]